MLIGSTHVPINFHFCHETLVDIAPLFLKKSCHELESKSTQTAACQANTHKNCCSDVLLYIAVDELISLEINQKVISPKLIDLMDYESVIQDFKVLESPNFFAHSSKPPEETIKKKYLAFSALQFYA